MRRNLLDIPLCETESDSAYRDLLKLEALVYDMQALVYDMQALVYDIQALVYDILPSTTATLDYAIGLEKLSANRQFFVDAQTAVNL